MNKNPSIENKSTPAIRDTKFMCPKKNKVMNQKLVWGKGSSAHADLKGKLKGAQRVGSVALV
jgi:hypothetical protein